MSQDIPTADCMITRSIHVSRKDWERWKEAAHKAGVRVQTLIIACCNAAAKSILVGGDKK